MHLANVLYWSICSVLGVCNDLQQLYIQFEICINFTFGDELQKSYALVDLWFLGCLQRVADPGFSLGEGVGAKICWTDLKRSNTKYKCTLFLRQKGTCPSHLNLPLCHEFFFSVGPDSGTVALVLGDSGWYAALYFLQKAICHSTAPQIRGT